MKYFKFLILLIFSAFISLYSCNDTSKSQKQDASKPTKVVDSTTVPNTTNPSAASGKAGQNAEGVWHYTCSIGCPGGAASATNCKNCKGLLTHNSAYHAKANTTDSSTPFASPAVTPPASEPSQNTAGVWHYTCGKGCEGGSGAAGSCATCGGALAHNSAYHK